jgi:hypothetical protein
MLLHRFRATATAAVGDCGDGSSSSSSGNGGVVQPLLQAQQWLPSLQTLIEVQLLAPQLCLIAAGCQLMHQLCISMSLIVDKHECLTQQALPLLTELVHGVGPVILCATKHGSEAEEWSSGGRYMVAVTDSTLAVEQIQLE